MIRVRRRAGISGRMVFLFAVSGMVLLLFLLSLRIRPVLHQMAVYAASDSVSHAINRAVSKEIESGALDCDGLVRLEKDENGNITALVTDMAKVNAFQTHLTGGSFDSTAELMKTKIGIPLGNLIGGTFLSGRGPEIPIYVASVTNTQARFENRFSSAGINQTRHQIILIVTVGIEILIPGKRLNTDVQTEMVLAETVIVGNVPDTFTQFGEIG